MHCNKRSGAADASLLVTLPHMWRISHGMSSHWQRTGCTQRGCNSMVQALAMSPRVHSMAARHATTSTRVVPWPQVRCLMRCTCIQAQQMCQPQLAGPPTLARWGVQTHPLHLPAAAHAQHPTWTEPNWLYCTDHPNAWPAAAQSQP
jgi:hypothetical protein